MLISMITRMAHPEYGTARPGEVVDLPDEVAKELLEAGAAVVPDPKDEVEPCRSEYPTGYWRAQEVPGQAKEGGEERKAEGGEPEEGPRPRRSKPFIHDTGGEEDGSNAPDPPGPAEKRKQSLTQRKKSG